MGSIGYKVLTNLLGMVFCRCVSDDHPHGSSGVVGLDGASIDKPDAFSRRFVMRSRAGLLTENDLFCYLLLADHCFPDGGSKFSIEEYLVEMLIQYGTARE